MEDLEIKITITYKVPKNSLTLTGLLRRLDHQRWIPFTTNIGESAFSRVLNRVKRIERRWSEAGLLNWLTIAFRKIFHPALWTSLWRQYLQLHRRLHLASLLSEYRWINAIR